MLNVSQEAKQAYMSGNAHTALFLTVTAEDGAGSPVIYSPTNILSGSVSIVESLCSAQAFDISRVEKNQLTFTLFNITENISDLQGKIVTAKQTITFPDDSTEDIPLGRYKIVEAVNDGDYLIKCTAYDDMLKLDAIADEWWNTDVTFPITIRDLLISMLTEVGIGTTGIPATFNNSTFEIAERTVYFDNASYSEVLGYIQEVVGAFFKIDRSGVMQMYSVEMSQTPDIEYAYQQIVSDLSVADFTVQPITALQVKGTEDDIGITVGVDGNVYVILGNPLLYNLTAQTGNTVCTNILTAISGVTYTPFTAKVMCQPYSEVGDTIALTTYKGLEAGSVVFNRTMSGARLSFDSIVSKGEQERSEVTRNVERQVTVLNQRTHEIVNDVSTLSSTITQIDTDLSGQIATNRTAIQQNSNEITLSSQRIGTFNLLTNSDFSNQTDRIQGWQIPSSGGNPYLSTEYVYDEDFQGSVNDLNHIENGYCLKLTPNYSGNGSFYQDINYTGTMSERIAGEITYKVLNADGASIQPFLRVFNGSTSLIYIFVGSPFLTDGEIHNLSWKVNDNYTSQITGVPVTKIQHGLFIVNGTENTEFEINHVMLTFSEDTLPYYAWTDFASKDLITQINLAPTGLRINADKITVDTSSLDLTFGSAQSSITIKATTADDGVWFDGNGKVLFETEGEFRAKNLDQNNYLANQILMRSNVEYQSERYNQISFLNLWNGVTSNQIYANAFSDKTDFWLYNNRPGATVNANNHYMGVSTTAYINRLYNFKFQTLSDNAAVNANYFILSSSATAEMAELANYALNNTYLANQVQLSANSTTNNALVRNYDISTSRLANVLNLMSGSAGNTASIFNYDSSGNISNELYMAHTTSGNSLEIINRNTSGVIRTGLYMNTDGTFEINTNTGGNQRFTMSKNGNLDVVGNNVVYLGTTNANGYISIKTGGVQKDCYWDSNGYLRGQ